MNFTTKHFLLPLLLFYCTCYGLLAQESDTDSEKAKLSIGIHLGIAFSNVSDSPLSFPIPEVSPEQISTYDWNLSVNGRFGVTALFHLKDHYGLETGLFYEKIGVQSKSAFNDQDNTISSDNNSSTRFEYEYFTVPILFKLLFNEEAKFQFNLHMGPYFSFLQSAFYTSKISILSQNPDGSLFQSTQDESIQITEFARQRDIGIRLRFGAERKISNTAILFAYAHYSRGLTTIEQSPFEGLDRVTDGKHISMGLTIGGYFKMR